MRYLLALMFMVSSVVADTQTKSPTAAVDDGNWSNPTNVFASDDNVSSNTGTSQHWLDATDFNFTIPDGATIEVITVSVEGSGNDASAVAARVQLIRGGSRVGSFDDDDLFESFFCSSDNITVFTVGSLWGTTFTPAQINADDFGASLRKNNTDSDCMTADHIEITVQYSPPAGGGQVIIIGGGE